MNRGQMTHKWRATHVMRDAEGNELALYMWRGAFFMSDAWREGMGGITRDDLREGETIFRLTDLEHNLECVE